MHAHGPATPSTVTDLTPGAECLREALAHAEERARGLEVALENSRGIGAAVGILMATRRLTYDAAFDLLRAESQRRNRKVRDLAGEVLLTGCLGSLQR